MNTKYLIPIKNGFLVYQPGSDIIYRGQRKTAELKHILVVPFLTAIVTPVLDFVANYAWSFLDLSGYRMMKYTILMIISGVVYYKFIYVKNKEKLLQLQLETVKLIDIKEDFSKNIIKSFVVAVIGLIFLFCLSVSVLINMGIIDEAGYFLTVILYTMLMPIFFVECELQGRFLLIKHLLKMPQSR